MPPYEVVGPLERFDQRDIVSRLAELVPGTPAYEAYYAAHPEKRDIHSRFRLYPTEDRRRWKQAAVFRKYPFAVALSFSGNPYLQQIPYVEGRTATQRVEIDSHSASENIKRVARYLGADLVGICEINPAWVYSHYGSVDRWGEPVELKHRYAIVVAVSYDFGMIVASRGFSKAMDVEYVRNNSRMQILTPTLTSYIRNLGYAARDQSSVRRGAVVVHQALAVDAGLGELGRNSLLITRKFGAAVGLGVVTTDMPLAVDKPVDLGIQDFCAKCLKCAVCCPTKSISYGDMEVIRGVKKWRFDAESCCRMYTAVGTSHNCARCVALCPWTKPRNIVHWTAAELAIHLPFTRRPFVWLDDLLYGRKPRAQPLPGWLEPGKRRRWKQRIVTGLHKI